MHRSFIGRALLAGALAGGLLAPAVAAKPDRLDPGLCAADELAGGDWSTMSKDLAGTRHQPAEDVIGIDNAASLAPAWAVPVSTGGGTGNLNSTPTVVGGCVFVAAVVGTVDGDTGMKVVALDVETGAEQWSQRYDLAPGAVGGLGGPAVSAVVVDDGRAITFVNEAATGAPGVGPYAVAIDAHTGAHLWRSEPFDTYPSAYTNGSPVVIPSKHGSVVFAGWSPPEGDSLGQGGFVLLDPETGALVTKTFTIPEADQADADGDGRPDNAGGGIWAPPSYDESSGYAFIGAGNTFSKTTEHAHTNAILKIDLGDRKSDTFGEIVGAAKGVPDQYLQELSSLKDTEACDASDVDGFAWPIDDPVCGQLDLDFGAPVNLYSIDGRTAVAGLQKAGIVHAFWTDDLTPIWRTTVGAPCAPCNAAATAVGPEGIGGASAPGGTAFVLDPVSGELTWAQPIGDGAHYNGVSMANGVYYGLDNAGLLDIYDAASGVPLIRRPLAADTGQPMAAFSSSGLAIAGNTVFVAMSGGAPPAQTGWVIAYRVPE